MKEKDRLTGTKDVGLNVPRCIKVVYKSGKNNVYIQLNNGVKLTNIKPFSKQSTRSFVAEDWNGSKYLLLTKLDRTLIDKTDIKNIIYVKDNWKFEKGKFYVRNKQSISWIRYEKDEVNCDQVVSSWDSKFNFIKEEKDENGKVTKNGLRAPQIGATYSILGHWTTSNSPATVVMPTGTGKTETMLCLLIAAKCNKVLVIVPTDALREQTANKFVSLGLLKEFGIVQREAITPAVGVLKERPKTAEEVDDFFQRCNVIVTTMSVVYGCENLIQKRISNHCSHLFIDEAHHIAAPKWEEFRTNFLDKYIVQFTATPFRTDGKHVDGKIIYNYPLLKAQEEGYFKPINFISVMEYSRDDSDKVIAEEAVKQLRTDLKSGFDHILMVRVENIARTGEVLKYYKKYREFNPIILHSKINNRKDLLQQLKNRETRIIICVDMLGEGFDLPSLKIAAMHDIHKSLGITLQFTGRFTRSSGLNLGDATLIANIGDAKVNESLEELYSEDADWNKILRDQSTQKIEDKIELQQIVDGFNILPENLSLQNIYPKMSTVIYRVSSKSWSPQNFVNALPKSLRDETKTTINSKDSMLIGIVRNAQNISWGNIKEIYNLNWDLYLLYFNKAQKLLYINSTSSTAFYDEVAEAVIGKDKVRLVSEEEVFKCYHNVNRVLFQNVGLKKANGALRYIMYTGVNVGEGLKQAILRQATKSNVFGIGYENGRKISMGCSRRGKIWSKMVTNISTWRQWCDDLGEKILNPDIDTDKLLEGVLRPSIIYKLPDRVPIVIEWPDTFIESAETYVGVIFNEEEPLYETEIVITNYDIGKSIQFEIRSKEQAAKFEMSLTGTSENDAGVVYRQINRTSIQFRIGSRRLDVKDYFKLHAPIIRYSDGSYIENNILFDLNNMAAPFNKEKIIAWNWQGVNIKKESQTVNFYKDSIQYHVIKDLIKRDFDIIFDDDDAGEAGDVITIKEIDDHFYFEFYHCKYSQGERAGARIDDLYVVCGQAQKNIFWKNDMFRLVKHMLYRNEKRVKKHSVPRFIKGTSSDLLQIEKRMRFSKIDLKMIIVQPGVSKTKISDEQLQLLGSTELYLSETYNISLDVIVNE